MEAFYTKDISLEQLSHIACMSKYNMIRLFKQAFGTTPHKYLHQLKMQHAKDLLQKRVSISEVTYTLGFADLPSFSKAFKAHYKISPSQLK